MSRNTHPSRATVQQVRARDHFACARCGVDGLTVPLTTQHRVARGMGGSRAAWINEPANLLTLCGSGTTGCHGWVESHPREAQDHGWSARRSAMYGMAVQDIPVWTWRGWLQLSNDGSAELLTGWPGVPECACGCRQTAPAFV